MKRTFKLQHPDLIQPKDKNHRLYQLLDEYLIHGDEKQIASKLEIAKAVVSNVKTGKIRSRIVWDQLVSLMMARKKERKAVMQYLESPL